MKIHGHTNTRLYYIWKTIKQRCYNSNCVNYKNYGKRKIKMCKEWKNNFINFYNWSIKNGYKNDLSIDRINNNGNYEPSNCRWVTMKEQENNKRNNKLITYNGETKTLGEWAEELKIDYSLLYLRIYKYDWNIQKAFSTLPLKKGKNNKLALKGIYEMYDKDNGQLIRTFKGNKEIMEYLQIKSIRQYTSMCLWKKENGIWI